VVELTKATDACAIAAPEESWTTPEMLPLTPARAVPSKPRKKQSRHRASSQELRGLFLEEAHPAGLPIAPSCDRVAYANMADCGNLLLGAISGSSEAHNGLVAIESHLNYIREFEGRFGVPSRERGIIRRSRVATSCDKAQGQADATT